MATQTKDTRKKDIRKKAILSALKDELSDDATLEDAIDYLYYLYQIEQGLADLDAGRVIPHEEAMRQVQTWLK